MYREEEIADLLSRLKQLNSIGIALSSEKNSDRLLERILDAARILTNADGGTLYIKTDAGLKFEIMISESLKIRKGGYTGEPITFPPLPLHNENGAPNLHMVAVCAALTGKTINIPDVYQETQFEFSGTRKFDNTMNYRSQSFLTVPMKDHKNETIGVLQLINARKQDSLDIIAFNQWDQELVESLTSQAAISIMNQRFIKEQKELFEAFIKLIANAIDAKSPHTSKHCGRVPEITLMLAKAAARTKYGSPEIRDFNMNEELAYELWIAAMLHDCGKITTKEYVVDKGRKLETIIDRIHLIDTRFEILKRDAEIAHLKQQVEMLKKGEQPNLEKLNQQFNEEINILNEERDFIRHCNIGSEAMNEIDQKRVQQIAQRKWISPNGEEINILLDDQSVEKLFYPLIKNETRKPNDLRKSNGEIENLCIKKGTLRDSERKHINDHIVATINMLKSLPYPQHLKNVPEFAGGHHERMDGKGYPNGLTRKQMTLPARVMGIADIFEALTSSDRPYKNAMPLSQALTILGKMKEENHIDPDLFDVFIHEKVYLEYAEKYLDQEQIDMVDIVKLPGYNPNFSMESSK
jgi:HD-GYP domain-containing protein (c-di-GMP phosphodiesterase class II)